MWVLQLGVNEDRKYVMMHCQWNEEEDHKIKSITMLTNI